MALPEEPAKKEEDVHEEEMPTLQEIRPREEHLTTHKDTLEEVRVDVQEFKPRDGNAPRCACLETVWKPLWESGGTKEAQYKGFSFTCACCTSRRINYKAGSMLFVML